MGVTLAQPPPSPTHPGQGFFGHESASGDFLTAINYFDFRDDVGGEKEALVTPIHTHTQRCNPKPMKQPPFTRSFIKQNLWKRKWSDTAPSYSFRCICQVLAAGPQGLKDLRRVYVSLYCPFSTWPKGSRNYHKMPSSPWNQLIPFQFSKARQASPLIF